MKCILGVDDDTGIPDSAKHILKNKGYEVKTAPISEKDRKKVKPSSFYGALFEIKQVIWKEPNFLNLLIHSYQDQR